MLLSPRKDGLASLFEEVRVFKTNDSYAFRANRPCLGNPTVPQGQGIESLPLENLSTLQNTAQPRRTLEERGL